MINRDLFAMARAKVCVKIEGEKKVKKNWLEIKNV